MNQNHKSSRGTDSPAPSSLLQDKKKLAIVIAGVVAVLVIIGVVAALWPADSDAPADADASSAWSEPEDDKDYDAQAGVIDKNSYSGTVLEETPDAGREYLDSTLFLGDSNTYRYMMYADKNGDAYTNVNNTIGVVSMGAQAITSLKCMQFQGYKEPVTMPEAVAIMQPQRIIIGFGSNNLGGDVKSFIDTYKKGLAAIHKAYPYADIIVNAVPPLDKQREYTRLTMKQVDAFNKAIAEMCSKEGYKFLDSSEALKDPETGWAKKDYTLGDGVHLNKDGVTALFEYICTHAYITEDVRPKPLKKIPKAQGVPPGLIEQDPIAVRGARVPVNFVATEGGHIEGKTSQMIKKGQQSSAVTAKADEGWYFAGWSASIGQVGGEDTLVFTVPGDADANGVVITATFKEAECDHDWQEIDRNATCTTDGRIKYQCSICGEIMREPQKALGHDYKNGVCTRCGAKDPNQATPKPEPSTPPEVTPGPSTPPSPAPETPAPHEHVFDQVERVEPTCGADGYIQYKCSCGELGNREILPATGAHNYVDGVCTGCGAADPNAAPPSLENGSDEPEADPENEEGGNENTDTEGVNLA